MKITEETAAAEMAESLTHLVANARNAPDAKTYDIWHRRIDSRLGSPERAEPVRLTPHIPCRNGYRAKVETQRRTEALAATTKTCGKCAVNLDIAAFHKDSRRLDGRYPWCKDCRRTYMGADRKAAALFSSKREYDINYRAKKKAKAKGRKVNTSHLWTHFRMTAEDYDAILESQGGGCAICGAPGDAYEDCYVGGARRLAVDHDHACCPGSRSYGDCNRGLLCHGCNIGLGSFQDTPSRMLSAIKYLEATSRVNARQPTSEVNVDEPVSQAHRRTHETAHQPRHPRSV